MLLSNSERLINVLQNERNNYVHIWKCGKYRKWKQLLLEEVIGYQTSKTKFMYALANLTFRAHGMELSSLKKIVERTTFFSV